MYCFKEVWLKMKILSDIFEFIPDNVPRTAAAFRRAQVLSKL